MPQMRHEQPASIADSGSSLIDRLGEVYGLAIAETAFMGGEVDRNYQVRTKSGERFLAKIQRQRENGGEARWREEILLHLTQRDLPFAVPTIVPTRERAWHHAESAIGDVVTLFNWVPGAEWAKVAQQSNSLRTELGATTARVTNALEGFPPASLPTTHHWDVRRSREAILSCVADAPLLGEMDFVQTTLDWFDEIYTRLESLPHSVVHQDLNDNNVLVDEQRNTVSGVLDFNDALYSVRVADLAIAGAYAMLRNTAPLSALGHVVAGYHSVNPLSDGELAVIYPLAAARLCVQVLTWTVRDSIQPTAYGTMRMKNTLPTLQAMLAVDPREALIHLRSAAGRKRL